MRHEQLGYALLAACALGCSDSTSSHQTYGELGNGTFTYQCVKDDALCADGQHAATLPDRVATNGVFGLSFDPRDSNDHSRYVIKPASTDVIDEDADILHAIAPGVVALVATRTSDGRVVDFIHMRVLPVARLRFQKDGNSVETTWAAGSTQHVQVIPVDDHDITLAGGLSYDWTTSDPKVVRLGRTNPAAAMDLLPTAPGTATISAKTGTTTDSFDVTVTGSVVSPPDAGHGPDTGDASAPTVEAGAPDASAPSDSGIVDGGSHD